MASPNAGPVLSFFLLLFALVLSASSASPTYPPFLGRFSHRKSRNGSCSSCSYETKHYTQQLDHFSFIGDAQGQGDSTFQQRYLLGSTDKRARPGAPIFFYCGNEGDIVWFAQNTGFIWEIAPRFNALVVFAEVSLFLLLLLLELSLDFACMLMNIPCGLLPVLHPICSNGKHF